MPGSRTRRGTLVATLAVLTTLAIASAAQAAAPGGIVQLPGTLGCLNNGGTGGCGSIHDSSGPFGFILSADGRNAYSASYFGNQVLIFDRNPSTGALTQKPGAAGCVRGDVAIPTCASARFLSSPEGLVISPDGRTLYVASQSSNAILVFNRDPATGEIAQKPDDAGCIADTNVQCRDARSLGSPYNIAISPDGKNLYSASYSANAVVAMNIASDGTLNQTTDGATGVGCLANAATVDCTLGRALSGPYTIAVSPDGKTIYAGGYGDASVVGIARDPATGRMTSISGTTGCVDREATASCAPLPELGSVRYLALDASGTHVYAATQSGTVVVLDRQADGRIARHSGGTGCLSSGVVAGCTPTRGLSVGNGVAFSPGGEHAYVAGGAGLTEYDVVSGGLVPRAGTTACITGSATAGCATGTGIANSYGVTVSPDGRFVYTSDTSSSGIQAYRRDSAPPSCSDSTITVSAGSVSALPLPCSDVDGNAFNVAIINPPTLGSLGAIDNGAHTVVFAAPQGQNGTTTLTFRASYPDGSFQSGVGSLTVTVVGAVVVASNNNNGVDNDHDGFTVGQDCNDNNAAIRPGALEIKGNRVDENCDGIAEPFATLTAGVSTKWNVKGSKLTMTSLAISGLPSKWSAEIRCSGSRCPFKKKTLKGKAKKGLATVTSSLKSSQRKFRAKQTLEVWVSAPNFNTKVARLVLKAGKIPATTPLCVLPGGSKPQKTCS